MAGERFKIFGTTFEGAKIVQSPEADDAKRRIAFSYIIGAFAPLVALILLWAFGRLELVSSLGVAALSAYLAFTSYWGIVASTRAAVNLKFPGGSLSDFAWQIINAPFNLTQRFETAIGMGFFFLPIALIVLFIAALLGILYGILGGGIREFLRDRRTRI